MAATPPTKPIDPARAAESNTAMIVTVLTVFHVLALVFVSLRVYARAVIIKTFGKDDIFMVLSALCAIGGWSVFIIQAQHGLGKHQETISKEDYMVFQHAGFWQSIISAAWALGFLKISIGFNLLRLSSNRWYSWALWGTIVFVCCYTFMAMMTFLLYCSPMAGYWNKALKPKCYPISLFVAFSLINTSFNIFTDVLFATFPIPIIWTLKMKRKLKLYLIGILSLGYFAVVMGIVKAVYQIGFATQPDKTFNQSIQFWGFLQLNIGIIAACATSLKPLFTRILRLSTTDRYNTPAKYGYGSRGIKLTGLENEATASNKNNNTRRAVASKYGMETTGRISDDDLSVGGGSGSGGNGKDAPHSAATSFYKHDSAGESSEEEFLRMTRGAGAGVAGAGVGVVMPGTAVSGEGIVRTTEVRVSVK